jgi:hemolysin III
MTATMHSASSSIVRPRLRGVVDLFGTAVAVPAAVLMVAAARPGTATAIAAVYGGCMCMLLIGSALYHRPSWPVRTFLWLRKIDLANIYLMIAGSATPMAYAVTPGPGEWLLPAIWIAAGLGILKALLWSRGHRGLNAGLYVVMGALTLPCLPALRAAIGTNNAILLLGGALLYLVGAVVYALRWPNPVPVVFGYHEVFHMFVFAAAAAHYAAIWSIVT